MDAIGCLFDLLFTIDTIRAFPSRIFRSIVIAVLAIIGAIYAFYASVPAWAWSILGVWVVLEIIAMLWLRFSGWNWAQIWD